MSKTSRSRLRIAYGLLVACLVLSPSWGGQVQAGDQEPDSEPDKRMYLPFASKEAASQQDQLDQPAPAEQMPLAGTAKTQSAVMPAPAPAMALAWSEEPPIMTEAQISQAEAAVALTNLSGPIARTGGLASLAGAPAAETQSSVTNSMEQSEADITPQLVPSDARIYRNVMPLTGKGTKSNVMEASVGQGGKYMFYTGNWIAARSANGGYNRTYVSPYAGMSDFCCDQVTLYDEGRDLMLWYRQSVANASGVNYFRLGVSTDGGVTYCNYDISPTSTNSAWTNQWWDYPHLQMGADYLYIASNMFDAGDNWTRSVMLRFPLESLRQCAGFGYNYYDNSSWFTFVPVQGADHIMYFASNWPSTAPQNSRVIIFKWAEDSASLSWVEKTVTAWTFTGRGSAVCGAAAGNWAARTDQRLLTGARYMIHGNNLQVPGRKIIAWWWNVAQGGGFGRPYIEAAAFYEDTLTQVSGNQGRPLVWNSSICFLYPSVAANKRGDLAMVLNEGTGANQNPSVDFAIADDFAGVPPGWGLVRVRTSSARPADNRWGDYNTTRPFYPSNDVWVGASHVITSTTDCTTCGIPIYFAYGRYRDYSSWFRWQGN